MVFTERFLWGVSTSGFQFEMGDPAGEDLDPNTDWFAWAHDRRNRERGIVSGDLPEQGINYWKLYRKDHEIARRLGLTAYRTGIEWSRIFPRSTANVTVGLERALDGIIAEIEIDDQDLEELSKIADEQAVKHYRDIIVDLHTAGFQVFVCLNHFTLPLWIHDPIAARDTRLRKGPIGWLDEKTIVEFTKYAAYLAWNLGDVADNWATFNEPMVVPEAGYLISESGFPPGLRDFKAHRKAAINMAVAHARAYDAIKRLDRIRACEDSSSPADVGVIHNVIPTTPLTDKESDIKAADFLNHTHNHFFVQAATTGWLDANLNMKKEKEEEKNYLRNRLDWIGVNYYTRSVAKGKAGFLANLIAGIPIIPQLVEDFGFACKPNSKSSEDRPTSDSGWEIYPEGMVEVLEMMKQYHVPMYITEHGIADSEDALRSSFITEHLECLDKAIDKGKLDVRGYFHWSLTDNYEWAKGFKMKFGLYSVNPETKERTMRKSANVYRGIIENKEVTNKI